MTDMMRSCLEWMMSLGWLGKLLGVLLLAALIVLVVLLIGWTWRASRGG